MARRSFAPGAALTLALLALVLMAGVARADDFNNKDIKKDDHKKDGKKDDKKDDFIIKKDDKKEDDKKKDDFPIKKDDKKDDGKKDYKPEPYHDKKWYDSKDKDPKDKKFKDLKPYDYKYHGYEDGKTFAYALLSGLAQTPPIKTTAYGSSYLKIYKYKAVLYLQVADIYQMTQAHIHVGGPKQNGPIAVWLITKNRQLLDPPLSIKGKLYAEIWFGPEDLIGDAFNQPTLEEKWEAFLKLLEEKNLYVNVHTVKNPAGEIRGQLLVSKDIEKKKYDDVYKARSYDEYFDKLYDDVNLLSAKQYKEAYDLWNKQDGKDKNRDYDQQKKLYDRHYDQAKKYVLSYDD